jgi:hypothetical protein
MAFWKTFSILFAIHSKDLRAPKMSFTESSGDVVAERFSSVWASSPNTKLRRKPRASAAAENALAAKQRPLAELGLDA